jgi:hypothetical protein
MENKSFRPPSSVLRPPSSVLRPPSFVLWALRLKPWYFILLSLLLLWPLLLHPNFIPFVPRAQFSDLLLNHLPNAEYWRTALWRYHQWPLWNAQIFAGQPFAADPLAGLWYPPNLVLLILPLPFAFNVLFVVHLAWAGYGLFCFLRAEGLSLAAAFLGGLTFMGTPKLMAHLGAGHVSLILALAWTPWLLLAVRRATCPERSRRGGGLRPGALAGVILALTFLADVRWAFYAGLLGVAFWVSRLPPFAPRWEARRGVVAALSFMLTGLALIAVLALPLSEFLLHSTRAALPLSQSALYSLSLIHLLGIVLPYLGVYQEWVTYFGLVPLVLAALGLARRTWFWGIVAALAVLFSLGSNAFLFPLAYRLLPGLSFLRVPPRAWFVVVLAACILMAFGLERLRGEIGPGLRRWFPILAFALASLALMLALGAALGLHKYELNFVLFGLFSALGLGTLALRCVGKINGQTMLISLALFITADLMAVNATFLTARPVPSPVPAAQWLSEQPGFLRVYSPSYSLPQPDALQHVDGVDPLHLSVFEKFMAHATGVPATGYSVTIPDFASEAIATANIRAVPDAGQLGLLNVKYIAAEFPIEAPDLKLVQTFGPTHVYENLAARPRAWLADETTLKALQENQVEIISWSPNQIRIRASGPGRLILSEIMYPGWQANVDGVTTPIETAEELLRSVRLSAGEHVIVFEFRPKTIYWGGAITALGWLAVIGLWLWPVNDKRNPVSC